MANLLVVDADLMSLRATQRLLLSAGHRPMGARSAAETLRILSTHAFDMVLLDPAIPDGPAETLLAVLADRCPETPVLIVATCPFNRALWQSTSADLRRWLTKGDFTGEDLLAAVARHLSSPHDRALAVN